MKIVKKISTILIAGILLFMPSSARACQKAEAI
jgi:hypothetical protein